MDIPKRATDEEIIDWRRRLWKNQKTKLQLLTAALFQKDLLEQDRVVGREIGSALELTPVEACAFADMFALRALCLELNQKTPVTAVQQSIKLAISDVEPMCPDDIDRWYTAVARSALILSNSVSGIVKPDTIVRQMEDAAEHIASQSIGDARFNFSELKTELRIDFSGRPTIRTRFFVSDLADR